MTKWRIRQHDPREIEAVARMYNVDRLVATCLINRGAAPGQDWRYYLEPATYTPPDPFTMPDMDVAVARIDRAIRANELICIYGDYDADGVTAISILLQGLRELGARVFHFIPDRFFEGVGLNVARLERLVRDGVALIITVDCGIRACTEMEVARQLGLDIIVTDHHTPDEHKPQALAVLNPKLPGSRYPFKNLCGAGVAFKLIQAMNRTGRPPINMRRYLQIAAIGTIADMVPLREENRWLVANGLREIGRDEHSPLRYLLRRLGLRGDVDALDISFKVAPRINAPGRLGDPDVAIDFLTSSSPKEMNRLCDVMEGMNTVRQMLEREVEAKIELQLRHAIRDRVPAFVMVAGKYWHRGILGIMACKLMRRYNRPTCVFSFDDQTAHGSMRGIAGVNLLDQLAQVSTLLDTYGGHPEAAGVSLPLTNLPLFKQRMNELLAPQVTAAPEYDPGTAIDAELAWRDLNPKLMKAIGKLSPFGIGNAAPVFYSANLILESELSRKGHWYHFDVSDGHTIHKCSFYHPIDLLDRFERYDSVDLVYSITTFRNEYQVQIVEMRPSCP